MPASLTLLGAVERAKGGRLFTGRAAALCPLP